MTDADDSDGDDDVSYLEAPFQPAVGGDATTSPRRLGGALCNVAIVAVALAVLGARVRVNSPAVTGPRGPESPTDAPVRVPEGTVAHIAVGLWAYFAPSLVEITAPLLFAEEDGFGAGDGVAVALGVVVPIASVGLVSFAVVRGVPSIVSVRRVLPQAAFPSPTLADREAAATDLRQRFLAAVLGPLVEPARDAEASAARRLCIVEDVGVTVAVTLCTSVRSRDRATCVGVAALAAALAAAHAGYVVVLRPFARRLDSVFATVAALLLFGVAAAATASLEHPELASTGDALFDAVAAVFFVQAFVALGHTGMRAWRRHRHGDADENINDPRPPAVVPLLAVPTVASNGVGVSSSNNDDDGNLSEEMVTRLNPLT